ncbi:MAG: hypothetical protein NZ534_01740, partial [Bacteroidia bacterium]|nr:hypothetical protein [Bacteroidia bacterium]
MNGTMLAKLRLYENAATIGAIVAALWAFVSANAQNSASSNAPNIDFGALQTPRAGIFVENRGQVRDALGRPCPEVFFVLEHQGAAVFFRRDGFSVVFERETTPVPFRPANPAFETPREFAPLYSSRLLESDDMLRHTPSIWVPVSNSTRLRFAAKNRRAQEITSAHPDSLSGGAAYRLDFLFDRPCEKLVVVPEIPDAPLHFYIPDCPQGCENVPTFRRLVYRDVFPQTDLVFYFTENGSLKYDVRIRPGGSPKNIRLRISPKDGAKIDDEGEFVVQTPMGAVAQSPPVSYWTDEKGANPASETAHNLVESRFVYKSDGILSLKVGPYPENKTLVVDPYLTFWATYVGTGKYDICTAVAVDAHGFSVSAGTTQGRDMPVTPGIAVSRRRGGSDLWMAKFDAAGRRVWATVHGGSGYEQAVSAALDREGAVVVGGVSDSKDFYTHSKAFQKRCAGAYDAYIVKLKADGKFEWATFLGGKDVDEGIAVSTDEFLHVYFVGQTVSKDFPVTYGAQYERPAGALDGFVAQLRPDGEPVWITYYGGSLDDSPNAVCADATGVYLVGRTHSRDLPTNFGVHQRLYGGGVSDGFLAKFDRSGRHQWTTYIGSKSDDEVFSLHADQYLTLAGYTQGADLLSSPVAGYAGGTDAFAMRFDSEGTLQWGTFF